MTKKRQINENNATKLNAADNKNREYEIETIQDSAIHIKELAFYLPRLYYLIL